MPPENREHATCGGMIEIEANLPAAFAASQLSVAP
jgi:hypothetical protein